MKDVKMVFTDRFKDVQKNLENANYSVCSRIAHDLVNFAWNLELKEEVFINEVLESVFTNLEEISIGYQIPKEIRSEINSDIAEKMNSLVDTYNTKDPSKLYESLKQLRYITTRHQLNVWQNYDTPAKIPRHMIKHIDRI